jgi:hypothetical protein
MGQNTGKSTIIVTIQVKSLQLVLRFCYKISRKGASGAVFEDFYIIPKILKNFQKIRQGGVSPPLTCSPHEGTIHPGGLLRQGFPPREQGKSLS